ncbi:MAG: NFACT RNA binding domain-containing protein, partial [Nitrososphaerales archaeon]
LSDRAIASRLFDEAKALEEKNRNISLVREDLEARKDALLEQSRVFEDRAAKRIELERRAREWFERYRWFLTSDLRLAVGGRDSTSNSIVINKYTEPGEFVFHADLHGSPFFVLKERHGEPTDLPSEIELELAQATVSFSRAWKDELGSADAFWVRPDQIKKSAPSGEYLPRGSFFIEGKKNFVKHLRLELSLGIMTSDRLPHEEASLEKPEALIQPVVVCGPDKGLSRYCVARVRIAPGKEKGTAIARRIKQIFVGKVKDEALREAVKKLSIDEFIRVLPSGNYKLISEKQNG